MNQFVHLILFSFIAAATVKSADKPAAPAQDIRSLMQRVNAWQLAHPRMKADDRNWERGTWYAGVTAAQRATGDEKFLQQALDWGNLHQWQVGTEGSGANKLFCAMTWVECYLLKKDPAMLKPTLDWLATDAPNSPGGAKVWFGHAPAPFDGPLYSDSLFAMPVFALLHQGDRRPQAPRYPRPFCAHGDRRVVRQGGRALLPRREFHRQEDPGRQKNSLVAGQRLGLLRVATDLGMPAARRPAPRVFHHPDAHHGGGLGEVPGRATASGVRTWPTRNMSRCPKAAARPSFATAWHGAFATACSTRRPICRWSKRRGPPWPAP